MRSCLTWILFCTSLTAQAWPTLPGRLAVGLNLTSDYVWRGYSKTSGKPSVQLYVDYEHPLGVYGGAWLSRVDFADEVSSDSADIEAIPYFGMTTALNEEWRLDVQLMHYLYDGEIFNNTSDYSELYAFVHYADLVTFEVAYTDDAYDKGIDTWNFHAIGRHSLRDDLLLTAGVGYFDAAQVIEYNYLYYDIGFTWFGDGIAIDLRWFGSRYVDAAVNTPWPYDPHSANGTFVVTATFGF
ncbi:MAG: TorF family putative porin [Gammaproteobacteria bacterium]